MSTVGIICIIFGLGKFVLQVCIEAASASHQQQLHAQQQMEAQQQLEQQQLNQQQFDEFSRQASTPFSMGGLDLAQDMCNPCNDFGAPGFDSFGGFGGGMF